MYIKLVLKRKNFLHVISFHFQKLFALIVVKPQERELSFFHLLLKVNIVIGRSHQSHPHVHWQDHIHDVHLLYNYTVHYELLG